MTWTGHIGYGTYGDPRWEDTKSSVTTVTLQEKSAYDLGPAQDLSLDGWLESAVRNGLDVCIV